MHILASILLSQMTRGAPRDFSQFTFLHVSEKTLLLDLAWVTERYERSPLDLKSHEWSNWSLREVKLAEWHICRSSEKWNYELGWMWWLYSSAAWQQSSTLPFIYLLYFFTAVFVIKPHNWMHHEDSPTLVYKIKVLLLLVYSWRWFNDLQIMSF